MISHGFGIILPYSSTGLCKFNTNHSRMYFCYPSSKMALEEFVQGFQPSMEGKLERHQNVELDRREREKGRGK